MGWLRFLIGNEKTGKWGFIDKQGKIVANPQFSLSSQFSEGLAAVILKDIRKPKYHIGSYITGNNDIDVISSIYETTEFHEPPDVYKTIAYGILRAAFNVAKAAEAVTKVNPPFDYLYIKIESTKIALCWGTGEPDINSLSTSTTNEVEVWGPPDTNTNLNAIVFQIIRLILAEFKKVPGADFNRLDTAEKSLVKRTLEKLSSELIWDLKEGNIKLDRTVQKGSYRWDNFKGLTEDLYLYPISKKSFDKLLSWGFINKNFDIFIEAKFDEAKQFSEGLAPVLMDNKWGFIDKQSKMVINPEYQNALQFTEKLAPVLLYGKWGYISR
jgi:hypothetical protein